MRYRELTENENENVAVLNAIASEILSVLPSNIPSDKAITVSPEIVSNSRIMEMIEQYKDQRQLISSALRSTAYVFSNKEQDMNIAGEFFHHPIVPSVTAFL